MTFSSGGGEGENLRAHFIHLQLLNQMLDHLAHRERHAI
jgi:hypothetical protein